MSSRKQQVAPRKKDVKEAAALRKALTSAEQAVEDEIQSTDPRVDQLLRVDQGFRLADVDPRATPGFAGGKPAGRAALAAGVDQFSQLQERLFAESRGGGRRSLLLVVQGMDTSGKGGIVRHVVGAADPQGVRHTAFKAPTKDERAKGFLWRIRRALPEAGEIGVFDRSHYEDVLIARVHELVPRATWSKRYATINDFERRLVERGTTVVKVMMHVSRDEQKERLAERLERPDKYWKYNPTDIDEREHWDAYQEAYQVALTRCSTQAVPWFVVPADRKWYARWAVQQLLIQHLERIDPQWPPADFDVDVEKGRLAAS
ncbi:polyphosphate kinase 2 family protein [Angustibacter luteus]|uniref:Polyphosphate kinase 2 family protein n=1 Tax=Angustibacter luteus TaxID=658456 RepID=A0ABW1JAK1_9ACTN